MDADAFRHFYGYHFAENRKVWDRYIVPLPYEEFVQQVNYSHHSVRDQIVHIMNVDHAWFSGLRGMENPESYTPAGIDDRNTIRAHWDDVEKNMREDLAAVQDDMLFKQPFAKGEDKDVTLWQVLLHVANHGTDHRAQVLRSLSDLGAKTGPQDYLFHIYDNMQK